MTLDLPRLYRPGTRVRYVPHHNPQHPDCESGTVDSVNEDGIVFVRFDGKPQVEACDARVLDILEGA